MYWLQLTHGNTGAKLFVNMDCVIVVAPNRSGGSNLVLTVSETLQKSGRQGARILPVREPQEQIMEMMSRDEQS